MSKTKRLEDSMVKYTQLLTVPVKECDEPLVNIVNIPSGYLPKMQDMRLVSGDDIFVRKSVLDHLCSAQQKLQDTNSRLSLHITYGYRTLQIQTERFLDRLTVVGKKYYPNPTDLYEAVHRSVAVPSVSGHPTGGAVDVFIVNKNTRRQLDFGSPIYNYSTHRYYVFSNETTKAQRKNRMLLRKVMMGASFAPFDGEWWHFSYGDREWAFYYKKPYAIYDQISYPFSTSQNPFPS